MDQIMHRPRTAGTRDAERYGRSVRHALFVAPFGELADPAVVLDLAATAEARGWDGLFLWDHVLRPATDPQDIADPWILLAAVATVTTTLRIGPMVTPVVRRRPQKLAREAVTLDHLSRGRLTLGLGLGVDSGRELSAFGETVDARERGDVLDEGAELLCALWSGERVDHHGARFTADDVAFLPRPVQRPRIPLWFAARGDARRPLRRAARYDGLFPIEMDRDTLARALDLVAVERGGLDGFDVAVRVRPGSGPADARTEAGVPLAELAGLGATWAFHAFGASERAGDVLEYATAGPSD
jgi:alkanesulfonate monooxygenase SsuD/methylene tetrahydromethanopterin reductase-like flavin-dependent oxidoreductase (luciferase family)